MIYPARRKGQAASRARAAAARLRGWLRLLGSVARKCHAPPPRAIVLELTNRCNLRCPMCWLHGEGGIGATPGAAELSTDEAFRVVDDAAACGAAVYLGGGEPLLRPDFFDVVAHARARGLRVGFTTNGICLERSGAAELVRLAVDRVTFSVHGLAGGAGRRRAGSAYGQAIEAIRQTAACRRQQQADKPLITVNLTVGDGLTPGLREVLSELLQDTAQEADEYRIHHQWFVTESELRAHQAATSGLLGCTAGGAASHLVAHDRLPAAATLAAELASVRGWPKVSCFPSLSRRALPRFYAECAFARRRCHAPFEVVVVRPDGDVRFCPDEWIDDYPLGNVRHEPVAAIWNNDRARRFRAALARHRCFPACKRCSFLYSA